jgi:hypothetical protein
MEEITSTASGLVNFNTIHFGKHLNEWIVIINNSLDRKNEYKIKNIKPGKFKYDVLASIIYNIFELLAETPNDIMLYMRNNLDLEPYMNNIHGGFVGSYLYWKNFQPDLNRNYIKNKKQLITNENNDIVTTYFEKLPDKRKNMYLEIFNSIMNLIPELILNEGMRNINMQ